MKIKTQIILNITAAVIAAFIIAVYEGYDSVVFIGAFSGFCLVFMITGYFNRKYGLKRVQKMQAKAFEQLEEKLTNEGVIDETEDIARTKRLRFVKKEMVDTYLSAVNEFAEIVNVNGKTYAIHRESLARLLGKLPLKEEETRQLTESERRILSVALSAKLIVQDDTGEWRKK